MKSWFWNKGYPQKVVEREMKRVKSLIEKVVQRKVDKNVVHVIVAYPLVKYFIKIVHCNLYLLYIYKKFQEPFTPSPRVFHRNSRKFLSYPFKAKLCAYERSVWWNKCYRERWQVCTNIDETVTFTSTVKEKTMNLALLIILLTRNKCSKQYVCQTEQFSI